MEGEAAIRLDLFLKHSRLVPRRTLAQANCQQGAMRVNGQVAKSGKLVRLGDLIELSSPGRLLQIRVKAIPRFSPGKKMATSLYEVLKNERCPEGLPPE